MDISFPLHLKYGSFKQGVFPVTRMNSKLKLIGGIVMRKISTALLIILILVVPLLAFAEGNATADRTISFEENTYVVYAGKAQKINATVENILDSAPKQTQLVWTSSDPDIAMVNAGGQVSLRFCCLFRFSLFRSTKRMYRLLLAEKKKLPVSS